MTAWPLIVAVAGIASMRAAMEKGDVDEAVRQGVLAGPAVVERALAAPDRPAKLAAIAAAPSVEGRAELLDALATAAAGPDRRVAIPAARAARAIALELATHDLPDDIAPDDARAWRDTWAELALRSDRWIELRVLALDTSAALERAATASGVAPASIGVALDTALADRDPAFRFAAVHDVPAPVPDAMRASLVNVLESDTDNDVALAAAQVLCFDGIPALTPAALERVKTLGAKKCLEAVPIRGSRLRRSPL